MRVVLMSLAGLAVLAAATSVSAQPLGVQSPSTLQQTMDLQLRANALQAQQDMAAREMVRQQNELTLLQSQLSAQQASAQMQAQSYTPRIAPPLEPGATPQMDVSQLASIPDAKLAESNRRVREAAANHH